MMFRLLFLEFIGLTYGSGETFLRSSASGGSLLKSVAAHVPSNLLKCALYCHLEQSMCEGFQLDTTSGLCKLYDKVFFVGNGSEVYFGRKYAITNQEASVNLALGKPSTQSSLVGGCVASRGNDGVYPTRDTGMTHTEEENSPWWRVDMQNTACVTSVYFLNRGYATVWQRAKNIVVTVSLLEEDIMDTGDNRCGYIDGVAQQFDNLVTCENPLVGRFVQLQILDTSVLSLMEVEVYGY